MQIDYSIVLPALNEEDNVVPLYEAIKPVMQGMGRAKSPDGDRPASYEIIFIDDASKDKTLEKLEELRRQDDSVKIIQFRRQFGQTAAWWAGFDYATGKIVITMDSDMQNDPKDIPAMIKKLNDDKLDVVSGWRKDRKDKQSFMAMSKVGNGIHRWVTGEKIHDHGCSLKVYRAEALDGIELYSEMRRYITALLSWKGFKVGEMVVTHHPRTAGSTKYNFSKKIKGFLDLLVVKFWIQYSSRPIHFFGAIGIAFIIGGVVLGSTILAVWLSRFTGFANSSLPLLAVLMVILGVQFLLTGVLADVVSRTYYSTKKTYSVKNAQGFEQGEER